MIRLDQAFALHQLELSPDLPGGERLDMKPEPPGAEPVIPGAANAAHVCGDALAQA